MTSVDGSVGGCGATLGEERVLICSRSRCNGRSQRLRQLGQVTTVYYPTRYEIKGGSSEQHIPVGTNKILIRELDPKHVNNTLNDGYECEPNGKEKTPNTITCSAFRSVNWRAVGHLPLIKELQLL